MHIESVKLSPKKGGNGYVSSFSFSIGSKEAAACGLIGKRIIKIIDEKNGVVSFKAKHFTIEPRIVYHFWVEMYIRKYIRIPNINFMRYEVFGL